MYKINNLEDIIKTVFLVSNPPRKIKTIYELKKEYKSFLKKRQPEFIYFLEGDLIDFSESARDLIDVSFKRKSKINDLGQGIVVSSVLDEDKSKLVFKSIYKAIDIIKNTDKDLFQIFMLIVNKIVVTKSNNNSLGKKTKGGSSQTNIGVIWIALDESYTAYDFSELLVHELIHSLVFLDEIRYRHFDYKEIENEITFSKSAILDMKRPLDKVLHSIVVSTGVLHFRKTNNIKNSKVHPETKTILSSTLNSISEIENNPNASITMLSRSFDLVSLSKRKIQEINSV